MALLQATFDLEWKKYHLGVLWSHWKSSEVDFRPLHKPPVGIPGTVPFPLLYQPRALTGEENEQ